MRDDDESIIELFSEMSDMINESELSHAAVRAVLCKILVLHSLNAIDKDELMTQIDYSWRIEKFFQPDSNEIH
jgi:hypothetical protein